MDLLPKGPIVPLTKESRIEPLTLVTVVVVVNGPLGLAALLTSRPLLPLAATAAKMNC